MKSTYKYLIGGIIILAVLIAISVQSLQEMTVYFYTPQELLANPAKFKNQTVRVGAMVNNNSVEFDAATTQLKFSVSGGDDKTLAISYKGIKPDMFAEGRGVVVEGVLKGNTLIAKQLLVKHSEEYTLPENGKMNPEMYKSLSSQ